MQTNNFRIMARTIAFAILCLLAGSCDKGDEVSIPQHLTGSRWSAIMDRLTAKLTFVTESQCVCWEKTEIGESEYSYTYEYRKPDIVLTPEESGREKLTGRIEPFDSHGLVLKLFLPAGEEYLRVYSGEYFK